MLKEFSEEKLNTFAGKKMIAFDIGSKKTGVAIFTPRREPFPMPLHIFPSTTEEELFKGVQKVIEDESGEIVVVGIPLYTDGKESEMTKKVRLIAKKLSYLLAPIPLFEQDETLSSFEAEERMKNSPAYNFKIDKTKVDSLAAAIILEDFFRK